MTRVRETSDYHETDNPEVCYDRGRKMWPVFTADAEGFVCGRVTWMPRPENGGELFMKRAAEMGRRFPIAPEDVVWPEPGWPVDADGRGFSVQEVKGDAYMRQQEIAQSRSLREWERRMPKEWAA